MRTPSHQSLQFIDQLAGLPNDEELDSRSPATDHRVSDRRKHAKLRPMATARQTMIAVLAAGPRTASSLARCKACGFVFDEARLTKPGKCPSCRGTRLFEALVRIE